MKYLVRVFLFNLFALWFTRELFPALIISGGVPTILTAGLALSILMLIVKPILKILFIPFNFLTFGIAGLFINVIVIYILTIVFPEVQIVPYTFPGLSWEGFVIPSVHLPYIGALLGVTFTITVISHVLHAVSEQ
jgi:putative membrane protein